jgi:mRNA-degrading endonuclease toxin of MazEF toxin-antitoxin module
VALSLPYRAWRAARPTADTRRVVAVTDQIRAVAKERLHERLAEVSASDLLAVETGVRRILELG